MLQIKIFIIFTLYFRNLVHKGNDKFNLMLLCWASGNKSTIHDHADAHCFLKVLDGNIREVCTADFYKFGNILVFSPKLCFQFSLIAILELDIKLCRCVCSFRSSNLKVYTTMSLYLPWGCNETDYID